MACVVRGCKSHSSRIGLNQQQLTFHRFPKDDAAKREWANRIGRSNWTPKNHSHLCSKHFTSDSFTCESLKWRRLRKDAFPTLCLNVKEEIKEEMADTDNLSVDIYQEEPGPAEQFKENRREAPVTQTASSENKYNRIIKCLENELVNTKKLAKRRLLKIRTLQKQLSRLKQKNNALSSKIEVLKEEIIDAENMFELVGVHPQHMITQQ